MPRADKKTREIPRTQRSAADGKSQTSSILPAVIQSLVALALQLNALAQHLGNNASPEVSPDEHKVEAPHECLANLVEQWHSEEDEDSIIEYPSVTCLVCGGDFTDDTYGESPTEPDEDEKEWFE